MHDDTEDRGQYSVVLLERWFNMRDGLASVTL